MRIVVQRVASARVTVDGRERCRIGHGLVVLVGVERADDGDQARWAAEKLANLRIFAEQPGSDERMQRSVLEVSGEVLVVSQFTLAGSTRKGRRPSFDGAAPPEQAQVIYQELIAGLQDRGARVATGEFRAMMQVELTNDGPVTFIVETGR